MEEINKLILNDVENGKAITVDRNDILEVGPSAVWKNGTPVTRLKLKREPKEGALHKGNPYYHVLVAGAPETIGQFGGVPVNSYPARVDQSIDYEQRRWEASLAILSALNTNTRYNPYSFEELAGMAIRQADILIEAYEKTKANKQTR